MARRSPPVASPITDESDIVKQVGAEPIDPENPGGTLMADEEKIREIGALDPESVQVNRRNQDVINRKKAHEKNVPFADPYILTKYEEVIKIWPVNTITILVNRLTGTPATFHVSSQPRTAAELYTALKEIHGRREDTTYDVVFRDSHKKEQRGSGRITMPSTLDEIPPQGQPSMNPYPYGYPPPQGYAAHPQPQQPQQQQQPGQPVVQVMPAQPQPQADPMAMMASAFEMFMRLQQQTAPQQQQPPQMPQTPTQQPQQPDQMAWFQQMFEMFQTMQQQAGAGRRGPPPMQQPPMQQQQMNPMMGMIPPMQPPPGTVFVPGFGFIQIDRLAQAISPSPAPTYRTPSYGPRYEDGGPPSRMPSYMNQQTPPQRQKTAIEELREAVSIVRTVADMGSEFNGGHQQQQPAAPEVNEDDDNPVKIIDVGGNKVLLNKDDGTFRAVETGVANLDKIFKFVKDSYETIQKANSEREERRAPPQQLPPGFVEVVPGYQPPPGYRMQIVDQRELQQAQQQQPLPQPPAQMPPPLSQVPAEEPRPAWGIPNIGGGGQ